MTIILHRNKKIRFPFYLRNVSIIKIALERKATNLRELEARISQVSPDSVYFHFWSKHLDYSLDKWEYYNDFANWVFYHLHNRKLAEKLNIIDPLSFTDVSLLTREVGKRISEYLNEEKSSLNLKSEHKFRFIQPQFISDNSDIKINTPSQLPSLLKKASPGSIFYHFIDSRRRNPQNLDDFSIWLSTFGENFYPVIEQLKLIKPHFMSLSQLKKILIKTFNNFFRHSL